MFWLTVVGYCLSMFLFASMAFAAVTRWWSVEDRPDGKWGGGLDELVRNLATIFGAAVGFGAVLLVVDPKLGTGAGALFLLVATLLGGLMGCILVAAIFVFVGLRWFGWVEKLAMKGAASGAANEIVVVEAASAAPDILVLQVVGIVREQMDSRSPSADEVWAYAGGEFEYSVVRRAKIALTAEYGQNWELVVGRNERQQWSFWFFNNSSGSLYWNGSKVCRKSCD